MRRHIILGLGHITTKFLHLFLQLGDLVMSLGYSSLGILYVLGLVINLGLHVCLGVLVGSDLLVELLVLFLEPLGFFLELVIHLL